MQNILPNKKLLLLLDYLLDSECMYATGTYFFSSHNIHFHTTFIFVLVLVVVSETDGEWKGEKVRTGKRWFIHFYIRTPLLSSLLSSPLLLTHLSHLSPASPSDSQTFARAFSLLTCEGSNGEM